MINWFRLWEDYPYQNGCHSPLRSMAIDVFMHSSLSNAPPVRAQKWGWIPPLTPTGLDLTLNLVRWLAGEPPLTRESLVARLPSWPARLPSLVARLPQFCRLPSPVNQSTPPHPGPLDNLLQWPLISPPEHFPLKTSMESKNIKDTFQVLQHVHCQALNLYLCNFQDTSTHS